jgi:hypothetical protein
MEAERNKPKRRDQIVGLNEVDLEAHRERIHIYKKQSQARLKAALVESEAAATSAHVGAVSNDIRSTGMLARACALSIMSTIRGCDLPKQ